MTVKELIEVLRAQPMDAQVHTDEDDYPFVMGVKSTPYDGPPEYTPPANTVLLVVDFPKNYLPEQE